MINNLLAPIKSTLKEPEYSVVLSLAWPLVVENILGNLVTLYSTFVVGHLGAVPLAAVSLTNQVTIFLTALYVAIGAGGTVLIARYVGARDEKSVENCARQALALAALLGLFVTLLCVIFPRPLLRLVGATPDTIESGAVYLTIVGLGQVPSELLFMCSALLRGAGDTRTPMKVMIYTNVVNVILSWVLVSGCGGRITSLGIAGAGMAVTASWCLGCVLLLYNLIHGVGPIQIGVKIPRFDIGIIREILRIGVPSGFEQLFVRFGRVLTAVLIARLGTSAVAGNQIASQFVNISFLPAMAFSQAIMTLTGQAIGREATHEINKLLRVTLRLALAVMCFLGAIIWVFRFPAVNAFSQDQDVIESALSTMHYLILLEPVFAFAYVYLGTLRGAADTRFVLVVQASAIWLVRLPLTWLFSYYFKMGLPGAWLALIFDWGVRDLLMIRRFSNRRWLRLDSQ